MAELHSPILSIVVPVYNESDGLADFHNSLIRTLIETKEPYEIIYCDDGSTDNSSDLIRKWCAKNPNIKLIKLSRNFGKEIAVTAGVHEAKGQAIITIDADGQHPVNLIPNFLKAWRAGAKVVVGLRTGNQKEGPIKRYGSRLFFKVIGRLAGVKLVPNATDFRLIDHDVQQEFSRMTERNRVTRGLVDWLGYKSEFIEFKAGPRTAGKAGYSTGKLFKLAIDTIVSLSISPLYISAYIGAVVLPLSALTGLGMLINALVGDPLSLHATGSAYFVVLLTFLVGILLVSQGIIGLYLSHIHTEAQNRPLYIIDKDGSANRDKD
jgi:polyisoprenyl-phosphate glycosyltransferase